MQDRELRWVEKATTVQPVRGDEVPPLLPAVRKVKTEVGATKAAIRRRYFPVWRGHALPRPGRHVDHDASLISILSGRSPGDNLHRLDRVEGDLIREHLALLVGNWL